MKKTKEKLQIDTMRERVVNLLFSLTEERTRQLFEVLVTGLIMAEASKFFDNKQYRQIMN